MRSISAAGLLALLLWVPAGGCGRGAEATQRTPVPVRIRQVERRSGQISSRFSGTIQPATRVDIAFRVGGYIESIAQVSVDGGQKRLIQEGDWVKKGTVLAQIRRSEYRQKLAAAQAAAAEALAQQKLAKVELDRTQKLVASQNATPAELDTRTARTESMGAQIQGANARIGEAQNALADCTLIAPMDGVVLARRIELGTLVGPGTIAMSIADTSSVKIIFGAPDVVIEKLRVGSPLKLSVETLSKKLDGAITRIAPSADPKSRVFEVESLIGNPKDELKVGMVVSISIPDASFKDDSLVLPLTAVVRSPKNPRGFAAFVVDESLLARLRDIELGDVLGSSIFVTRGLKVGERVVSMGATLLRDGDAVRVIP